MKTYIVSTILCSSLLLFSTGCDRAGEQEGQSDSSPAAAEETGMHDRWWCVEHGIVEKECGMCQKKLGRKLREEGDWCKIHSRPQTQCFKCDPDLAEPYTKRYVIRYGKQPPQWTD